MMILTPMVTFHRISDNGRVSIALALVEGFAEDKDGCSVAIKGAAYKMHVRESFDEMDALLRRAYEATRAPAPNWQLPTQVTMK